MYCRNCGKPVEDSAAFCINCGNKIERMQEPQPQPLPKSNKKAIIAIACAVVVIAGAAVALFMIKPWESSVSSSEAAGNGQTIEQTENNTGTENNQTSSNAATPTNTPTPTPTPMPTFTPTPTPTPTPTIPPDSTEADITDLEQMILTLDSKYITREDLLPFTLDELGYLRNGVYALSGYIFKTDKYKEYFAERDWYSGTVSTDSAATARFNDFQKKNLAVIQARERELGR